MNCTYQYDDQLSVVTGSMDSLSLKTSSQSSFNSKSSSQRNVLSDLQSCYGRNEWDSEDEDTGKSNAPQRKGEDSSDSFSL